MEISKLAQSILSDPPDSATFIAYSIIDRELNNTGNLVRINPCIMPRLDKDSNHYLPPKVYQDDEKKFMNVLSLDMNAVEDDEVKMIVDVADKFIVLEKDIDHLPNQMIRDEGNKDVKLKLGFGSYREAKEKWEEIVRDKS